MKSRGDCDASMQPLRVTLDLDPDAIAITGCLTTGDTQTRFEGLLELVSLLERVRDQSPASDTPPHQSSTRVMDANPAASPEDAPRDAELQ